MADCDFTPSRVCASCKSELPATLEHFPPHKMGRHGLNSVCRPCKKRIDAERRSRPDQLARQQAWRDSNKRRIKAYNEAYRESGYKSTEHVATWRANNIEYARAKDAQRNRARRRVDPEYSMLCRMRARLSAMKRGKASRRTEDLLGYTMQELKDHIQRQFTGEMTWAKFMAGEIHIDHIVPVAAFSITSLDCDDFKRCWSLSNLRPLWAADNRAKGSKLEVII